MTIQTSAQRADARLDKQMVTQAVHLMRGPGGADILIVGDAPSREAYGVGLPMSSDHLDMLYRALSQHGISQSQVCIVRLCPPIAEEDFKSQARKWAHVQAHQENLIALIRDYRPKIVVTFGELATRCLAGRAIAITKARGTLIDKEGLPPILPMLSPGFVARIPEHASTFDSDIQTLAKIRAARWDASAVERTMTDYRWANDISEYLGAGKPQVIGFDSETTGLDHWRAGVRPITAQFAIAPGKSICLPIDEIYWQKVFPGEPVSQMHQLRRQLKELLEDPTVRKIGSNIKFDHLAMTKTDIHIQGWLHDTQLLAFAVDENMLSKSLDQCVRRWVPEMSGYADAFNAVTDKGNMIDVPPNDIFEGNQITTPGMLNYAGGDPDASLRLARVLLNQLKNDPRQTNCYRRIQMPAILMFAQVTEQYGVRIDKDALRSLAGELQEFKSAEYRHLIRQVPAAVRRDHIDPKKGLRFSRADFVIDTLFSEKGFNLEPKVFTESTRELKDPSKWVPSTSTKDHFPYFVTHKNPKIADFVTRLIEYQKTEKMLSTYVGLEAEGSGFWQYLDDQGNVTLIHPSFALHKTNTGRTASSSPNGQNFPKRGRWAKPFLRVFLARDGYKFAASDLSQIELRLVAWEANEPTMLAVYRAGGDIHETTAAVAMGVDEAVFKSWKTDDRLLMQVANEIKGSGPYLQSLNPGARAEAKVSDFYDLCRYRAKAINFGYIYGMSAGGFRTYAKTQYGVDYTEREAEEIREAYFRKYSALLKWHARRKQEAEREHQVRGLCGAVRHLPSMASNDRGVVSGTKRQAVNAPIQRLGSDLCLIGAVRLQAQVHPDICRVVLTIHDQVVLEVKDGYEEEMVRALCWTMQNPPLREWFGVEAPLPFGSDAEIGTSLGRMAKRGDLTAQKPSWWNDDEEAVLRRFTLGSWKELVYRGRDELRA